MRGGLGGGKEGGNGGGKRRLCEGRKRLKLGEEGEGRKGRGIK